MQTQENRNNSYMQADNIAQSHITKPTAEDFAKKLSENGYIANYLPNLLRNYQAQIEVKTQTGKRIGNVVINAKGNGNTSITLRLQYGTEADKEAIQALWENKATQAMTEWVSVEKAEQPIAIHTDGSYKEGTKKAGYAVIMTDNKGRMVYQEHAAVQSKTNNFGAEMAGAIAAIQYAQKNGWKQIHLYPDLENILLLGNGTNQPRAAEAKRYVEVLSEAKRTINIEITWTKGHSGNRLNEAADVLANQATNLPIGEIRTKTSTGEQTLRNTEPTAQPESP